MGDAEGVPKGMEFCLICSGSPAMEPNLCSALPVHVGNELPCARTGLWFCCSKRVYLIKAKHVVNMRLVLQG